MQSMKEKELHEEVFAALLSVSAFHCEIEVSKVKGFPYLLA